MASRITAAELASRPPSDVVRRPASRTKLSAARVVCLIRIANCRSLRRRLGLDAALALAHGVAEILTSDFGSAHVEPVGRDLIELWMARVPSKNDIAALASLADRFNAAHSDLLNGERIELWIGTSGAVPHADSALQIERAEFALGRTHTGCRLVIHGSEGKERQLDAAELTRDLAFAADRNQFHLVYQPKVNIRKRAVGSAEALIRWRHPEHGLVMPDHFITLADQSGAMPRIALWTLQQTIADQRVLLARGHDLRLFVNMSGQLLADTEFMTNARNLVLASGAAIGFEITETSVIKDPDAAINNLRDCAAAGIALAIDDYGSGLSSLAYLKQLPVSELKIDKLFVSNLTRDHRDPLIVRSTIDLAHALDMDVTAEGVETPAALALLTVMGCEMVQGYLISQPLAFDAFQTYLDEFVLEASAVEPLNSVIQPESFWKRA